MEINFWWCSVRLSLLGCHSLSIETLWWMGNSSNIKKYEKGQKAIGSDGLHFTAFSALLVHWTVNTCYLCLMNLFHHWRFEKCLHSTLARFGKSFHKWSANLGVLKSTLASLLFLWIEGNYWGWSPHLGFLDTFHLMYYSNFVLFVIIYIMILFSWDHKLQTFFSLCRICHLAGTYRILITMRLEWSICK